VRELSENVLASEQVGGSGSTAIEWLSLNREKVFVSASVTTAFFVRLLLAPSNSVINGDGIYYVSLGQKFISGDLDGGISAYWSPLYSALCGLFSLLFSDTEFAGRFVSIVAGSLVIIPVFLLIREFYGRAAAYIGSSLIVLHPMLITSSGWVMTESVYTLTFISCIWVFWRTLSQRRVSGFLLTGALFGAAFLIKPEAVGFLGLVPVLLIVAAYFGPRGAFRRFMFGYFVVLLGFLILFLPYVIFLHSKTGQWTISQKIAVNLPAVDYEGELLKLAPSGKMTMKDRIWGDDYQTEFSSGSTGAPAASKPYDITKLSSDFKILGTKALTLLKKQLRDYLPAMLPYACLLLAIIGMFRKSWTRKRAARELFLLSFVFCTLLGYAASSVELRYLVPLIPILIAWTANGIVEFGKWTMGSIASLQGVKRRSPIFAQAIILICILASFAITILNTSVSGDLQNMPIEEKLAGTWIKDHSDGSAPLVMSANNTVAFYARARHIYLPDETLPAVIDYARQRKVDYVVISERRKGFTPTLDLAPTHSSEELELIYRDTHAEGFAIYVYRLKGAANAI
jgi:4-amino-4-deoxy-L-arabinose transferase-like glycosyltransferase